VLVGKQVRRLIRHYTRAVERPCADPEEVHQLRVCSRRAGAALSALSAIFPSREARALSRTLKVVRRAAGRARDCDVLIYSLRDWGQDAPTEAGPAATFLIGHAMGERDSAQRELERTFAEVPSKELRYRWRRAHKNLRGRKALTLGDLCAEVMNAHVEQVLAGLELAAPTPEQLHRLRIEAKRARYTLEVFAGCYEDEVSSRALNALSELQETLGSLNDSTVALARLDRLQVQVSASAPELWVLLAPGFALLSDEHRKNQLDRATQYRSQREAIRDSLGALRT